ncbi:polyphosphate kinase 2 family protein [Granulicella arctica]|uniref:PPK2 family polyphosphate:nucleotide phosphotransferase n=1 Tax=Granulicella arctica TaxID=940613 RepID=A0A7Y9PG58_9BACT|nr:polyphosphate kinase 2 family protein [Granulicella arctica]NYF79232.1 PPK2 family polyphosphate:nucleotide phosphotransferase [Granulicella arctica]
MKLKSPYLIKPDTRVRLSHLGTDDDGGYKTKEEAAPVLVKHRARLDALQDVFYASQQHALLLVIQGMDTAGKDGTIRHIFSGINPQGCDVTSFKVPTTFEARHDFLWRAHNAVPPRGMIGIFNRSHYEDVLSPRVHKAITGKEARQRLDDINQFEGMLADNGVLILKFFLHISQAEQTARLRSRIDTPDKQWKLSAADFKERKFWHEYQGAYDDLISATSHKHAPWFVIPSDHKWYRNVAISQIIADALDSLKLSYPTPELDPKTIKL